MQRALDATDRRDCVPAGLRALADLADGAGEIIARPRGGATEGGRAPVVYRELGRGDGGAQSPPRSC